MSRPTEPKPTTIVVGRCSLIDYDLMRQIATGERNGQAMYLLRQRPLPSSLEGEPVITLVDAPDKGENEFNMPNRESQRTYKITDLDPKIRHTVRITRHPEFAYQYIVENLVGGKWHRLLTGDVPPTVGGYGYGDIPFDEAARRAEKVLL